MPIRVIITPGHTADYTLVSQLIEGLNADNMLADWGDDSKAIVNQLLAEGMKAVFPSKSNCKEARAYDEELYKLRHLVENLSSPQALERNCHKVC